MPSLRVTLVVPDLDLGGTQRQVAELVTAASPHHASCHVVCLGEEGPLAEQVRGSGATVHALGLRRIRPWGAYRLARELRRSRPDVVYGVLFWGYSLALPLAALVVPGARRVAGRRSLPDTDRPGQGWAFGLRRLADRLSHAVVANSGAVAAAWIETNERLRDRMHVVENGVRLGPERPPAASDGPVTIVCVASLVGYKGHATLLEALTALGDTRAPWRVWLIGSGPDEASLRERIAAGDLTGRVELLGRQEDVGAWLEDADAAVLASYTEGLPNAVLEAMAYGLPVVATDVGGIAELLADGAGLVVPPADAPALATALRRLIDDPELRARLGAAGRDRVARRFGIDAMRDRTLALFRSL